MEELLSAVWGFSTRVESRAVDMAMATPRRKVERDPKAPRHLLTVRGEGYQCVLGETQVPRTVSAGGGAFAVGRLVIDLGNASASSPAGSVRLTSKEVALLRVLAAAQGASVPRADLLREVWGRRDESRALDHALRRLREKLGEDGAHLESVRGLGVRLVATHADREPLVGREQVTASLEAAIAGHGWVTIVGPGGVGKTTLARSTLPTALFADLSLATSEEDVFAVLHYVLHMAPMQGIALEAIRSAAAAQRRILLLDNVEQLESGALSRLQALAGAGEIKVVATSRLRLGGQEYCVHVKPLPEVAATSLLSRSSAAEGRPLVATQDTMLALVRFVDCLPLGIELVAAALRMRTPEELLRTTPDRVRDPRRTQERHRGLEVVFS